MNDYLLFLYMTMLNIKSTFEIFTPFLLLSLKFININMYNISKRETYNIVKNNIHECISTGYMEDNSPRGLIITRKYNLRLIIYIPENSWCKMFIFTTKCIMEEILTNNNKKKIEKIEKINEKLDTSIDYWNRTGDYVFFDYIKRKLHINPYKLNEQQQHVFNNIMNMYNNKNNVKCFIYGKANSGKTILSYLIARKINASICDTFNPTEPSDSFSNLYYNINPTAQKPLIVLMDEIDIILNNIHNEKICLHKKNTIQIYNKITWNNFLDKIDYGLYPNVILILCSNKSWEDINLLDESYLREGRVDLIQHLIKI